MFIPQNLNGDHHTQFQRRLFQFFFIHASNSSTFAFNCYGCTPSNLQLINITFIKKLHIMFRLSICSHATSKYIFVMHYIFTRFLVVSLNFTPIIDIFQTESYETIIPFFLLDEYST